MEAADAATDFVLTGPATNLNWALQRAPHLTSKVGRVFWMAGAVDVDGNIRDSDDDKAQERDCYDGWSLQVGQCMQAIMDVLSTDFQCVCGYHVKFEDVSLFKPTHLRCQKTSLW